MTDSLGGDLPRFFRVRQHFVSRKMDDVTTAVASTLEGQAERMAIQPGQTIAIAVGSRGIANLPAVVRAAVDWVRSKQGRPVIVPAMGSHGGATEEGQAKLLCGLGIDPSSMGCEVRSSMETVELGRLKNGLPLLFDAIAHRCDHVLVINRVKPHTRLTGKLQSGLAKMLLIGLGKHRGALAYHEMFAAKQYCLDEVATEAIPLLLSKAPVRLGLAIVEDAFEQTAHVEAIPANDILHREVELQELAAAWMPSLPFQHVDLLIVDQMGKEISGTGMDTNVVGRKWHDKIAGPDETPRIEQIYVRGLTPKSAGNACGIGIAEFCRSQLVRDMDRQATWVNCLTGRHVTAAAVPMHFETDVEVLKAALSQVGDGDPRKARWIWIRDTLQLAEMACSEAFLEEARQSAELEILQDCVELPLGPDGQLREPG